VKNIQSAAPVEALQEDFETRWIPDVLGGLDFSELTNSPEMDPML